MEASSASSEPSSPAYLRLLHKNSAVYSSLLKKVTKADNAKKKPPSPSVTPSRREKTWSLSLRSDRAKAPKIPQAATLKRSFGRGSHLCFEQLCVDTPEIGQGFFGTVYKARHPSLDLDLACKVLKNGGMEAKLEFLKEVKMLQTLVHPNLLPLIDCFVNCGNLYLVTPFMPKGSLGSVLRTFEPADFPWGSRISIALDIAKGMEYLHSQHIVHRDLKADNVLLSEDLRAVVADFGLAEEFGPQRRLQQGGTWSIMAPEVLKDKPFDERCDIFSFGILLCELGTRLLSRDVPRTDDFGVSVQQMVDDKVLDEGCPRRFMDLITACCCIDPAERPSFASIVVTLGALTLKADDGWNALGFKALKRECQVRALPDTGNKQELVKRLSLASLSLSPPTTVGPPSSHRVHPLHEHPLCVNPELREKMCSAHLFEGGCLTTAQSPLRYICSVSDCEFALCLDCFGDKRPRVQVALGVGAVQKAKLRFEALGISDPKRLVFDTSPVQPPPPPSLAQSISNLLTPAGLRSKRTPPPCDKKISPLPPHRRSSDLTQDPSPLSHFQTPRSRQSVSSVNNYPRGNEDSPRSSRRRQSDDEENPHNSAQEDSDHRNHRRRKSEEILTASPCHELFRSTSTSSLFAESQPHMFYHNSSRSPSSVSRKSSIAWDIPEQVSPSSRGTHRPPLPLPPPSNSTLRRHGTQRRSSFTLNGGGRPDHSPPCDVLHNAEVLPHQEEAHETQGRPKEKAATTNRERSLSAEKAVGRALLSLSASPRALPVPLASPRRAIRRGVVYACLSVGLEPGQPAKIVELEIRLFADRLTLSPAFTSPNTVTPIKPVFFAPVSSTAPKSGMYVPQTITVSLLRCSVEFGESPSPRSLSDVDSEKAKSLSSFFWFRVREIKDPGEKILLLGCQREADRNLWMNAISTTRDALRKPSEDPDTVSLMRSLQQQEPSSAAVSGLSSSRLLSLKVAFDVDSQAIKKQQATLQALLQRNQAWLTELGALDAPPPPSPLNSTLAQSVPVP